MLPTHHSMGVEVMEISQVGASRCRGLAAGLTLPEVGLTPWAEVWSVLPPHNYRRDMSSTPVAAFFNHEKYSLVRQPHPSNQTATGGHCAQLLAGCVTCISVNQPPCSCFLNYKVGVTTYLLVWLWGLREVIHSKDLAHRIEINVSHY